jgi:hypothetical protein
MDLNPRILRISAIGAVLSVLMMLMIAMISFPKGLTYPGLEVLNGTLLFGPAEMQVYLNGMRILFVLDGMFLVGWIASWIGIATLIRTHYPLLSCLTLCFGLAGALLDLTENSIIWGAVQQLQVGSMTTPDWVIPWKVIQQLSYWLPFLGALLAAAGLWSKNLLDRVVALIGSAGVLPAVVGLYFPNLSLLSNLWFLIWFASTAILLWRRSSEMIINPSE